MRNSRSGDCLRKEVEGELQKEVRLGDVLVKKGIIDENQLQTALSRQREQGRCSVRWL